MIQTDVGRPVSHIKTHLKDEDLVHEAQKVLDTLVLEEREVGGDDGHWYLKRVMPYRTADNIIDGIVITFTDITARKLSELAAGEAQKFAESIVETVREPLLVLDADLNVLSANRSFYRLLKLSPPSAGGRSLFELMEGQWNIPELRTLLEKILPENREFEDFAVEVDFGDLGHKTLILNARRIHRGDIGTDTILLAMEDVSGNSEKQVSR